MTLTMKQIGAAALAAGFTGNNLKIAVSIAMAESRGNPNATNSIGCVGLWQINQPVWVHSNSQWTVAWLQNPNNNAQAAMKVFTAQGWQGWSVYNSGAYQRYMDKATAATANLTSSSSVDSLGTSGTTEASGPPSGAVKNISPDYVKNAPTMSDFYLMGSKLEAHIQKSVISATAEFTTDLVSQLTIQILDPGFKFLASGLGKPETPARLQNMDLVVATLETSMTAGNPVVTLKCRPKVVQDLKKRTGSLVMSNVSPSDFVKKEVEAVNGYAYIQSSPVRTSVSRDVPEAGQSYDLDQIPSTWTTFQRLADELGYIVFEENGTVFFGQPTYFTSAGSKIPLIVNYNKGDKKNRSMNIPECSKSVDSDKTTISCQLPLARSFEARCGRTMRLGGVPEFEGDYMVSSVSYNIAGSTDFMTVEAETPIDPVPQGDPDAAITGSLNDVGSTSDGHWPLPDKYKVTTKWGVPGNWAAGHHTGADFACPNGTPVYAVYDGTIEAINDTAGNSVWGWEYGNHIILKVGSKEYGFCHLSRITVAKGANVKSGQVIGYSGSSGRVTGPHLHLELRHSPYKYGDDDNPIPTLMKKGVSSGVSSIGSGMTGSKLASDFVYWAQTRAGGSYVYAAARNPSNTSQMQFDCSSLIQWAAYQAGIKSFPGDTVSQIAYLERAGASISVAKADKTRGALLYKSQGGGKNDHVAISLGNGKTIEASSPSVGITSLSVYGRGFNLGFIVPGLRY